MLFFDFLKAYDSVWHQGFYHNLQEVGFVGKSFELIQDIYKNT